MSEGVPHATLVALIRQAAQAADTRPWLRVTSGSMSPLLRVGDEVAVAAVAPERLQVGDVLVLDEGHGFLTHRLRQIRGELLYTRGDRSLVYDAPFGLEQVVGRVTAVRRNGRENELNPTLNQALHHLAQAEEQRLACLRQIGRGEPLTLSARAWHRFYFYRRWWLVQKIKNPKSPI